MAQFTVHPEALTRFGQQAEGLGQDLDNLVTQLLAARVGRDSFGHIPSVGSRIYDAYDHHVDQCEQVTQQAASAVHSVAANIALTATAYAKAEANNTVR